MWSQSTCIYSTLAHSSLLCPLTRPFTVLPIKKCLFAPCWNPQHNARHMNKYCGMSDWILSDPCPPEHHSHVLFTWNAQQRLKDFIQLFHRLLLSVLCGTDMMLGSIVSRNIIKFSIPLHMVKYNLPPKKQCWILGNMVDIYVAYVWFKALPSTNWWWGFYICTS